MSKVGDMTINPEVGTIPVFTRGDRMRKAREITGLSQQAFADELGVSVGSVKNYESDKTRPKVLVLRAWSLRTGVPLEWLEKGIAPSSGEDDGATGKCSPRDSNPQPTDLRSVRRLSIPRRPYSAA